MSTFYTILHMVIMVRFLRVYVAETYLFCCYTGQVDILSVRSTKASELNANGACGSSSKDSLYFKLKDEVFGKSRASVAYNTEALERILKEELGDQRMISSRMVIPRTSSAMPLSHPHRKQQT